jgi:D-alanine-D-alanine ligase
VKTIWVICGGVSPEHDISILSAKNIVKTLLASDYSLGVVYIDRVGRWFYCDAQDFLTTELSILVVHQQLCRLLMTPGSPQTWQCVDRPDIQLHCDVVFPIVHGIQGEDGSLQGLFNVLNIPYVGSDVMASAVCMAKHIAKDVLRSHGLPVVAGAAMRSNDSDTMSFTEASERFGLPLFVKPASSGSSIGVSKVTSVEEYEVAVEKAFSYDLVVLIEKAINGREIECSVKGNEKPQASIPGEIVVHHHFYDFEAKYKDASKASVVTPADLSSFDIARVQALASKAYQLLDCCGLARVDFFISSDNEIFINEVNTLPGFTDISMYPKNWEVSGCPPLELLEQLISLAEERHGKKRWLQQVSQNVTQVEVK